jgi:ADP-heptose:LPS heptosyltransferase
LAQWGIGDAVLFLPLLRGLKLAYPDASLELIGKSWLSELFDGEGCCDRTHELVPPWTAYTNKYLDGAAWRNFITELRNVRTHQFDWLIAPRFDPREILQLRLLRSRHTFGFAEAGGRRWITRNVRLSRNQHDSVHRIAVSQEILEMIVPGSPKMSPFFRQHGKSREAARHWLTTKGYKGGTVLAVHSGAGRAIRRWRESHFQSVLGTLSVHPGMVVFIDSECSAPIADRLAVPQVGWRGSLSELKALLSVCDVLLSTDSGVMHVAAASGCKVVAAFGPTEPRWFGPVGNGHEIGIVEPMPCRPCMDVCIYPRPVCLDRLEDTALAAAVDRKLTEALPDAANIDVSAVVSPVAGAVPR